MVPTLKKMARTRNAKGPNTGNALQSALWQATESGVIDVPQEVIDPIVAASHCAVQRLELMAHVQRCLCETSPLRWRRIHAGLLLATELVSHGAKELLDEMTKGRFFDMG